MPARRSGTGGREGRTRLGSSDLEGARAEQGAARRWVPYFVLLLGLSATGGFGLFVHVAAARQDRARFGRAVERTRLTISHRMETYALALHNIRALFQTGGVPNRQQFHGYLARVDLPRTYPGLQGIGFSVRFASGERETWAKAGREHVDPDFRLHPDGDRDDYHAILYLEPLDARNRLALGFDMHTEPVRAAAMDAARDAAAPAASGRVKLVQESDDPDPQAGFLIYMPLYRGADTPLTVEERREKLYGYIYAPFRARDLMRGIFTSDPRADIDFVLYDGDGARADRLLYDSSLERPRPTGSRFSPRLVAAERMVVSGRPWTILFANRPEFEGSSSRGLTPLILALGSLASLSLFAVARSQVNALAAQREALARLRLSEAELRRAKEAAEAANRAKDQFLATLSHELRTPLNAILGWSHLLRSGAAGECAGAQAGGGAGQGLAEGLDVIERNAKLQAQLVEELLDMSRISSGKLCLEARPVELAAVVRSAAESVRPAAEAKGIELQVALDGPCAVNADATRLQQVVWNLLTNAVKFTPPGGRVSVSAAVHDSRAEVIVADTGEGIAPEFLPHVFDRFSQADATSTRRHGGLGLGLSIARHLAELHGGAIRAESPGPGRGATFVVSLPLGAAPAPAGSG